MKTVIEIMKSLVEMNDWTVKRFDLHSFNYAEGTKGYAAHLDVEEKEHTIIIRSNGSFEFKE